MNSWLLRIASGLVLAVVLPGSLGAQSPMEMDILEERDLARDRFEVSRTNVQNLARRRLEAARMQHLARYQMFLAGRGTLPDLLASEWVVTRAQAPLSKLQAMPRQALEERWVMAWHTYHVTRAGYESGRISSQDYYEALFNRLDAEVRLAQTRPAKK